MGGRRKEEVGKRGDKTTATVVTVVRAMAREMAYGESGTLWWLALVVNLTQS